MGDHPRPCGEKSSLQLSPSVQLGSPPPMRGKVLDDKAKNLKPGITPAHAGKSELGYNCALGRWDHPRPCGEKQSFRFAITPQ